MKAKFAWGVATMVATLLCFSLPGFAQVTVVNTMSGSIGQCGGSPSCAFTFPNNTTSGNTIVVAAWMNHQPTGGLTVGTPVGTGCPSSFSSVGYTQTSDTNGTLQVWTGTAAGSGACVVTFGTASGTWFSNWNLMEGEYSGVDATAVDASGSANSNSATTLSITAGNATTATGDLALVCYEASNRGPSAPTASGWTLDYENSGSGEFSQSSISSGTTVSFSGTNFNAGGATDLWGVMTVLKAAGAAATPFEDDSLLNNQQSVTDFITTIFGFVYGFALAGVRRVRTQASLVVHDCTIAWVVDRSVLVAKAPPRTPANVDVAAFPMLAEQEIR